MSDAIWTNIQEHTTDSTGLLAGPLESLIKLRDLLVSIEETDRKELIELKMKLAKMHGSINKP